MNFNLLRTKEYASKIKENVFEDTGIKALFDDFFDHDWEDLADIIECLPYIEETKRRQKIFYDFLNDSEELFNKLKYELDITMDAYKQYKAVYFDIATYLGIIIFYKRYIDFIESGKSIFEKLNLVSQELLEMKVYFNNLFNSDSFHELKADVKEATGDIKTIEQLIISYETYNTYIEATPKGNTIRYEDKLLEVAKKLGVTTDITNSIYRQRELNPYYYNRLQYVYPKQYSNLQKFHNKYVDKTEYNFEELSKQLDFYIKLKRLFLYAQNKKIPFSSVEISDDEKTEFHDLYDITIINRVDKITPNDSNWDKQHHVQIVTGANGGGKTTYLRSIGANFVFFTALGYVFARKALISPIKYLDTHFPMDENFAIGYGRLYDELDRLKIMSPDFSNDCLLLLNETFSSTDEETAFTETVKLLETIEEKGVNVVYITHQTKLLRYLDLDKIILLNPVIDEEHGNRRTFKISRVNSDVHSFTNDILKKYGLSKEQLKRRREDKNV
ncbi:MAG: hypothetical protein PHO86_05865 [Bacilli bacterium]|nr:hypothetical protein [Bacilli bacterium]